MYLTIRNFGWSSVSFRRNIDCRASEKGKCYMLPIWSNSVGNGYNRGHLHLVVHYCILYLAVC